MAAGIANPSPPMAGLTNPSGARRDPRVQLGLAGGRLLEHDRVTRQALGERREDGRGGERIGPGLVGHRRGPDSGRRLLPRREPRGKLLARRGDGGEQDELCDAAVCLVGVVGHDGDPGVRPVVRPRLVRVLTERRRADDEDGVEGLEDRAKPRPIGRQVPGEARVVLRKPRPGAERLLPDGRLEPLCDLDQCVPRSLPVSSRADDDRRALGAVE